MSSCFFSSRLKMRISLMSESRKRRNTALPKEPVPPVIRRTLSLNMDIIIYMIILKNERLHILTYTLL